MFPSGVPNRDLAGCNGRWEADARVRKELIEIPPAVGPANALGGEAARGAVLREVILSGWWPPGDS